MRVPVLLLALAACSREPTFDERYEDAQAQIDNRAASIDNELAAAQDEKAASELRRADAGR